MIIACVWTGTAYSKEYVIRLHSMISRYSTIPFRFICLSDSTIRHPDIEILDIGDLKLPKWWGKMALFDDTWRRNEHVVYFDLDTVIIDNIDPLLNLNEKFAISHNFTRESGNKGWPCKYGSCVMVLGKELGPEIWHKFWMAKEYYMTRNVLLGDQMALQEIYPNAKILQRLLPQNFLIGYRQLTREKPKKSSVVVFAGRNKPHNSNFPWVKEAWS